MLHLTFISRINHHLTVHGTKTNSADPDQKPQNVASDQGLHCTLTVCSIKGDGNPDDYYVLYERS